MNDKDKDKTKESTENLGELSEAQLENVVGGIHGDGCVIPIMPTIKH